MENLVFISRHCFLSSAILIDRLPPQPSSLVGHMLPHVETMLGGDFRGHLIQPLILQIIQLRSRE